MISGAGVWSFGTVKRGLFYQSTGNYSLRMPVTILHSFSSSPLPVQEETNCISLNWQKGVLVQLTRSTVVVQRVNNAIRRIKRCLVD